MKIKFWFYLVGFWSSFPDISQSHPRIILKLVCIEWFWSKRIETAVKSHGNPFGELLSSRLHVLKDLWHKLMAKFLWCSTLKAKQNRVKIYIDRVLQWLSKEDLKYEANCFYFLTHEYKVKISDNLFENMWSPMIYRRQLWCEEWQGCRGDSRVDLRPGNLDPEVSMHVAGKLFINRPKLHYVSPKPAKRIQENNI